jgi:hypothetical protein
MDRLRTLISRLTLLGSLALASSAIAGAAPCVTGSLQSYIDLNLRGGCSLQDTIFRFSFSSQILGGAPVVANASQITVTPINEGNTEGFNFSAIVGPTNYFETPSGSVSYQIGYTVDPLTGGADMSLDPPFGDVRATQQYCLNDVLPTCSLGLSLSQSVSTANPPSSLTSHVDFPIPASSLALVDVRTTILLNGPAGFDALIATFNTSSTPVSPVPEPSAASLALGGLFLVCGVGGARRWLAAR